MADDPREDESPDSTAGARTDTGGEALVAKFFSNDFTRSEPARVLTSRVGELELTVESYKPKKVGE